MSERLEQICEELDPGQYSFTDADRFERSHDWGTDEEDGVYPDVVIWPESTADVSAVLAAANDAGIPVTPYAAGTSLEGNAVPLHGGISLDLTRMDAIHDIRPDALQIDVGPGIYGDEINAALENHGLILPSLPSSGKISTIGGMIANDASGMKTVKYGEVADWLLEAEAVLPSGEVLTVGSKAAKTSSGYNVLDLLVGSEGTLAVVTRLTLRLTGRPEQIWAGRATFSNLHDAADAVFDAIRSGVDVAKIELIDSLSAEIANTRLDTDLPNSPMVFLEFHANQHIEAEVDFCRTVFDAHDIDSFEIAEQDQEMAALWEARRELADAVEPYDPDLSPLTPGDVTVPIDRLPDIVDYIKTLGEEHDIMIPCFGHAGDGNIHYFVMVDPDDPAMVSTGQDVSKQIVARAVEMGGTATGEHGIGIGKREYVPTEHDEALVATMRSIKSTFDPNGILNPGKIFPDESDSQR
ncbi:FAD-dependent oxidoreductase (GlcD/DLD domain protein) [Natrialba magadii ATCC 43099]|uniref:D-lactate dehydrogenase (cytochrome) n=1 Tax=Natrialba magadii (strain ATCC 43099 / DSM 3394 / CCM 3739 / CIP 104546 / IAM 13178 / JCM 8861 / NBRC 102185 / NCIMB 2190 / MS3) TaxID=547559 RepID=D3SVG0_NATMM|nr:FAD-binding oxidoreductase [Natrialba magadii]ADD05568.1 FAD-dependent oxidoreductase (GlcD/DLD domain protein) [Natrialba magadii ATCC 43099]